MSEHHLRRVVAVLVGVLIGLHMREHALPHLTDGTAFLLTVALAGGAGAVLLAPRWRQAPASGRLR